MKYNNAALPEHKGNPLIEALPPILEDLELILRFKRKQPCNSDEKQLPAHIRKKCVARIAHFLEPSIDYVEVHRAIEDAILQGYTPKNPLKPSTQQYLHYANYNEIETSPSDGRFKPRGTAITMVGPSGAGKSYMIERILDFYPQKITHTTYKKKKLNFEQIVWLKIDCPENISITGLLAAVLTEFDRMTGTNDAEKSHSRGDAIAKARVQIEQKFKFYSVGLFVIDEIQNLNINNERLKKIFLQLILVLINRTGVPILFCGNPEVLDILKSTLKNARRAESGGLFFVSSIQKEEWNLFVTHLWRYQWTNIDTPLTKQLSDELFKLSNGLPDFAVRTFQEAQKLVIGTDDESISCSVLREGYSKACALSKESLDEMREYGQQDLVEYGQFSEDINKEIKNPIDQGDTEEKDTKINEKIKIADVNRVLHPEFGSQISHLRDEYLNNIAPHIEQNVLRQGINSDDPVELFKEIGLLLENPI